MYTVRTIPGIGFMPVLVHCCVYKQQQPAVQLAAKSATVF